MYEPREALRLWFFSLLSCGMGIVGLVKADALGEYVFALVLIGFGVLLFFYPYRDERDDDGPLS